MAMDFLEVAAETRAPRRAAVRTSDRERKAG
jgi:hypothetical protein